MISGLDTDTVVKELMSAQTLKKTNIEHKKTKLEWKKEKWDDLNTKIYSLYTEKLSGLKLQGSYMTKKATSSNEKLATATATTAANGTYTLKIEKLASSQFVTGKDMSASSIKGDMKLSELGINVGTTFTLKTGEGYEKEETITTTEDTTVSSFMSALSSKGIQANFDEKQSRIFLSSNDSGTDNRFTLTSDTGSALAALGLMEITEDVAADGVESGDVIVRKADDSVIELNGARLTSKTSSVSAGGLTINLAGTTEAGQILSLTVSNDVDAVYDKFKEFVKSYNELLEEMNGAYNAKSAKDYAMLTDEQREEMSEKEVELWDNKIKDSLLRGDTTLKSLTSAMRTSLQESVEIDGKKYSLSSFGVTTGTYTEKGKLHIYGDSEDSLYADKADLLKKSLSEDPETTAKALAGIMSKLYNTLTDKMKVSTISSALTFYNDKSIQNQVREYDTQISNWETKLADMEERYYKQFSNMEKAMADLQSKQNQLTNMLGT